MERVRQTGAVVEERTSLPEYAVGIELCDLRHGAEGVDIKLVSMPTIGVQAVDLRFGKRPIFWEWELVGSVRERKHYV